MNSEIVKEYITEYKREFSRINRAELYKWKAIKHFQEHFDLEAIELASNIEISMDEAKNLLASGKYWPKRMLRKNAELAPERVRELLRLLFDEDFDLKDRIQNFRADFKELNYENFEGDNNYQDHRAILVYLVLMYPNRYFLYKFGMFRDFAKKVKYPYQPRQGRIENIGHFLSLCELVKAEIEKDQELLTMHRRRLDETCFQDHENHVLTQDFIYAVVQHLKEPDKSEVKPLIDQTEFTYINSEQIKVTNESPNFKGSIVNFIQNEIENKRVGDAGELWVVNFERESLIKAGRPDLANRVRHMSKEEGDGLGYDILSFFPNGKLKYVEVKTTKGDFETTFYISRNELEWSKKHPENYQLYRLFQFTDSVSSASLKIIRGDLSSICQLPVSYKVDIEVENNTISQE